MSHAESLTAAIDASRFAQDLNRLQHEAAKRPRPNLVHFNRVVPALLAHGFENPDNVGAIWLHPQIRTPDGEYVAMHYHIAEEIGLLWESMPDRKPKATEVDRHAHSTETG